MTQPVSPRGITLNLNHPIEPASELVTEPATPPAVASEGGLLDHVKLAAILKPGHRVLLTLEKDCSDQDFDEARHNWNSDSPGSSSRSSSASPAWPSGRREGDHERRKAAPRLHLG